MLVSFRHSVFCSTTIFFFEVVQPRVCYWDIFIAGRAMKFKKVKEKSEGLKVNSRCYKLISETCKVLTAPGSWCEWPRQVTGSLSVIFRPVVSATPGKCKFSGCTPDLLNHKLWGQGLAIYVLRGCPYRGFHRPLKFENHWPKIMHLMDLTYPFQFSNPNGSDYGIIFYSYSSPFVNSLL